MTQKRDWNQWENLSSEELQARRKNLFDRMGSLERAEKEFASERDDVYRELRAMQAKEYGLERTIKLQAAIIGDERPGLTLAQDALKTLLEYTPEFVPESVIKDMEESEETETPPFFSESFLYPLLGKDEARSVLARIRGLNEALGGGIDA